MSREALRSGPLLPDEYMRASASMIRGRGATPGIDVSKWQGEIDWIKVSKHVDFAIIRAMYGWTVDPRFEANWKGCGGTSIIRGAYQYLRPGVSAKEQASLFCELMLKVRQNANDLPLVLDVESVDNQGVKTEYDEIVEWCEIVEVKLNVVPIVYIYPSYWTSSKPMRYPLWISHVLAPTPILPASWKTWLFWQLSYAARVDGITTDVDLDVFDGSLDQLKGIATILSNAKTYASITELG